MGTTTYKATLKGKDIQRIKDKLHLMRERENRLNSLAEGSESRKVSKSIDTLQNQVNVIQRNLLNNYRPEFVECRDMGHNWKVKSESVEDGRMYRILTCPRCHTIREEVISRYGDALSRVYTHPEGYLLTADVKGTIGFSKAFWRSLSFQRATP